MKVYHGRQTEHGCAVDVEQNGEVCLLHPRDDVRSHSKEGFEWGSSSPGAAQLALALAVDVLRDKGRALKVYRRLESELIASLSPDEDWMLTEPGIRAAIESIEQDRVPRR